MKTIILFLSFFSLSTLLLGQEPSAGYVDFQLIFQELPEVKQAEQNLNVLQQSVQQELEGQARQLQAALEQYQQRINNGQLTQVQQEQEAAQLQQRQSELQQYYQQRMEQVQKQQQQTMENILRSYRPSIMNAVKGVTHDRALERVYILDDATLVNILEPTVNITPYVKQYMYGHYTPVYRKPTNRGPGQGDTKITILQGGNIQVTKPGNMQNVSSPPRANYHQGFYSGGNSSSDDRGIFIHTPGAGPPPPLPSHLLDQTEQAWMNQMQNWIEEMANTLFDEIKVLVQGDVNAANNASMIHYINMENSKCKNIYQKLDYRQKFLSELRKKLNQ